MAIEQNKNIEKVTNSESFLEGYPGENESVVDAKEVDRAPEVVLEETGTPKSPQNVKPLTPKSSSSHLGFPWPEELDSEKEEDTKPSLLGFFSSGKKCDSSCEWGCKWAEAERKRAA